MRVDSQNTNYNLAIFPFAGGSCNPFLGPSIIYTTKGNQNLNQTHQDQSATQSMIVIATTIILLITNIAYIMLEGGARFYNEGKFWLLFGSWAVILAVILVGNL